jgi:hypothetical protein
MGGEKVVAVTARLQLTAVNLALLFHDLENFKPDGTPPAGCQRR